MIGISVGWLFFNGKREREREREERQAEAKGALRERWRREKERWGRDEGDKREGRRTLLHLQ